MRGRLAARILVVDDQRANAEVLTEALRGRGYDVVSAADGQAALEQVRAVQPDMVISDILMPGMDGYELCAKLRAQPSTALLPIILVTSLDAHVERVKGLEVGADDFLSKPVNWEELFARVRSLLRVKSLQDELKELNQKLEQRVVEQVAQLHRLGRMKRFFSKPVAEAIVAGGSSLRDYRQASGELGYFQHRFRVYDREGKPCPKRGCGGKIKRLVQGARSTFYCPTCQR